MLLILGSCHVSNVRHFSDVYYLAIILSREALIEDFSKSPLCFMVMKAWLLCEQNLLIIF